MNAFEKVKTLLLTAAAAAAVQSCADGTADTIEGAPSPMAAGAATSVALCPEGTSPVPVGVETHCRLEGVIGTDVRLTAGPTYQIAGRVQVGVAVGGDGTGGLARTLTIEPGVRLYGAGRDAMLEIARGSRLVAEGEADAPILFTSAWDVGAAAALGLPERANPEAPRGEWGGIVLSGASDAAGAHGVEGAVCTANFCERLGEAGLGLYGGVGGRDDDSGILRHVEIRFAGALTEGPMGLRRVPALTLQGVGAGTDIADVTIVNAFGDGLKLMGGWAEVESVAVLGAGDDGVEWDLGFRGVLRRVVAAHDARLGDGDAGFEGASRSFEDARGPAHAIVSAPTLVDVTVIGDPAVSDAGILLRDGTGVTIRGATIAGRFARAGFDVDGAAAYQRIGPGDLQRVRVNVARSPGLSTDFDDRRIAALFSGNALEPVQLTLSEALARRAVPLEPSAPRAGEAQPEGRFRLTDGALHTSTDL